MNSSVGNNFYLPYIVQSGERIARLKEKIDGIQVSIEREKSSQVDQINAKLEMLDDRVKQTVDARSAAISSLSSEVFFPDFTNPYLGEQAGTIFG